MKKAKTPAADEMRSEYRREDLGSLVRGKYVKRIVKARRSAQPTRRSGGGAKAGR